MPDEEPKTETPSNAEGDLRSLAHEMHDLAESLRMLVREMNSAVGRPALLVSCAAFALSASGLWMVWNQKPVSQTNTQEVSVERPETMEEAHIRMIEEEAERVRDGL